MADLTLIFLWFYFLQVDNGIGGAIEQKFNVNVRGEILNTGLRIDEDKYVVCGELKKGLTGDETIQLHYKMKGTEEAKGWELQEFSVPATDTSFELNLGNLRGIEGGKEYVVRIRYFQR